MADIGNQLTDLEGGLERFLEALDNASFKMGSNAALESAQARAAFKMADQDKRFKKKLQKIEKNNAKETARAQEAHAKQIKSMQPLYKKMASAIGQEIKTKSAWLNKEIKTKSNWLKKEIKDKAIVLKQVKGLGAAFALTGKALKKTASRIDTVFKSITSGLKGLGAGVKGGIGSGLSKILDKLEGVTLGLGVGKALGAAVASAKLLYDVLGTNEKMMTDITKQTGLIGKSFKEGMRTEVTATFQELGKYGYTLKETLKLTQDLREAFGDVSYVTGDLIKKSSELQMLYRIPADDANELVESMTRVGYDSDKFLKTMERTAIVMGADVGMTMRDVAKNTQMIELYAGRGEEYFARMASRAALLGTNMQDIENSGAAFEDFDQMAENLNVMTQLFGPRFQEGLKNYQDIYLMYQRGDMLGIQEHIANQVAKTLKYEDGKLISLQTQDILYVDQIKKMAKTTGMSEVAAARAIKAAKMQQVLEKSGVKLTTENLERLGASKEQQDLLTASTFDYSLALYSALRETRKLEKAAVKEVRDETGKITQKAEAAVYGERLYTEEKINEILQKRGKGSKKAQEELLAAGIEELKRREALADVQGNMEEKTLETMTRMERTMASLNKTFETLTLELGITLESVFGAAMTRIENVTTAVGDALTEGFTNWDADKSITENMTEVLNTVLKGAVAAMWDDVTPEMLEGKGLWDTFEFGFVKALGGAAGEDSIWNTMTTKIEEAWDYGLKGLMEAFYWLQDTMDQVGTDIGIKINSALSELVGFTAYSEEEKALLQTEVDERKKSRGLERDIEKEEAVIANKKAIAEEKINKILDDSILAGGAAHSQETFDREDADILEIENALTQSIKANQTALEDLTKNLVESQRLEKVAFNKGQDIGATVDIRETLEEREEDGLRFNFGGNDARDIAASLSDVTERRGVGEVDYKSDWWSLVPVLDSFYGGFATNDERLIASMLELTESNNEIKLTEQDLVDGFIKFKAAGFTQFDETTDKFIISAMENNKTFTEAIGELVELMKTPFEDIEITIDPLMTSPSVPSGWQNNTVEEALGSVGEKHQAIIGEAGTEVGITRSALKELSSIGVPGYAEGRGGSRRSLMYSDEARYASQLTGRELPYRSRGGVDSRADRAADNKRMRELIVKPQREFLENQRHLNDNFLKGLYDVEEEGITKGHVIWAQGVKEFFTQYPALIDRIIGEPFRRGGAVSEGIYKSVFSGLQAYSRTELAGGTKKEARRKMFEHMVAEGVKEGGIIDQGFDKLKEQTDLRTHAIQGGLGKELKAQIELKEKNDEIRASLENQREAVIRDARIREIQGELEIIRLDELLVKQTQTADAAAAHFEKSKRVVEAAAVAQIKVLTDLNDALKQKSLDREQLSEIMAHGAQLFGDSFTDTFKSLIAILEEKVSSGVRKDIASSLLDDPKIANYSTPADIKTESTPADAVTDSTIRLEKKKSDTKEEGVSAAAAKKKDFNEAAENSIVKADASATVENKVIATKLQDGVEETGKTTASVKEQTKKIEGISSLSEKNNVLTKSDNDLIRVSNQQDTRVAARQETQLAELEALKTAKKREATKLALESARAAAVQRESSEVAIIKGFDDQIAQLKAGEDAQAERTNKQIELAKTSREVLIAQNSLLGGIQAGMAGAIKSFVSGGSRKEVLERGAKTFLGGAVTQIASDLMGPERSDEINEYLGIYREMGPLVEAMIGGSVETSVRDVDWGKTAEEMLSEGLRRSNVTFEQEGYGMDWESVPRNAKGRVYGSPHLTMVGEGSQNEVIIPTERIRKGLPINKGVANELSSIGVPGFQTGAVIGGGTMGGSLVSGLMDGLMGGGELDSLTDEILSSIDSTTQQHFALHGQHFGFYQGDAALIGERHIELTTILDAGFKGMKDGFDLLLNLTQQIYESGNSQRWKPLFGKQDKQISFLKDIKIEIGKVAKDGGGGGGGINPQTIADIRKLAQSVKGMGVAATGKKVSSPTLMMTGEEGRDEIIIPTERIRKGMPISKDVAKELESIGVPGFNGGGLSSLLYTPSYSVPSNLTNIRGLYTPPDLDYSLKDYIKTSRNTDPGTMDKITNFLGGESKLSKGASGSLISAGLEFGMTLAQGGDMRTATFNAVGAGIGYGAQAAITAFVPPPFGAIIGGIVGPMIGNLASKGLNKLFGKKPPKPKYGKYRARAVKNIEEHVQTQGMFSFGQPSGVKDQIQKALTGAQKNKPSDEEQKKLIEAVAGNKYIGYGLRGQVGPQQFLGLLGGAVTDARTAMAMYDSLNQSFYGKSTYTEPVMMAEGGVVTRPTHAVIGEAGPEAVIPLTGFAAANAAGGYERAQQYSDLDQKEDNKDMIMELKKQNQQMSYLIRKMGDAKTVLNVDGRQLAEAVGQAAFDINNGQ